MSEVFRTERRADGWWCVNHERLMGIIHQGCQTWDDEDTFCCPEPGCGNHHHEPKGALS